MLETLSPVLIILAGLVLLFTGRKVIWLAAALVAFLFVYTFLQRFVGAGGISLFAAIMIALVFSWLAIRFVKTIGFLIGALAGALALPFLLGLFGVQSSVWILALIGAVIGIILVSVAFDWGMIIMTAWLGANAVVNQAPNFLAISAGVSSVVLIVLLIAGIAVQAGLTKSLRRRRQAVVRARR
jgi:hypothetical protein